MQIERRAVFLDRDGVLIHERGDYTYLLEDLKINNDVFEGLKMLAGAGFIFIVISNQSGIAKGIYTKQQADYLHLHISRVLQSNNISIEEFYYCPHHPTISSCICRKPDSQLLEKAIARFRINASQSWFIGDADRDVEAGRRVGVKTLLIEANASLLKAAEIIVNTI